MRQHWDNLSSQEQRTVKWGAIALGLLIVVRFIWWPLYSRIDILKADIENERALVEWMHPTVAMLKKSAGQTKSTKKTPRLSTIEKAFSNAGLSPFVKHLSQNENKEIVVHMQDVPFASFAQCLEDLDTKNGIEPLSLSATKKSAGIVDADIVF